MKEYTLQECGLCNSDSCDNCSYCKEYQLVFHPNKETILEEAQRVCTSDRKVTHGSFDENFTRAAAIFNAWTKKDLTPVEINMVIQALKMAREVCNPEFRDNLVDQAGYLFLRAKMKGIDP